LLAQNRDKKATNNVNPTTISQDGGGGGGIQIMKRLTPLLQGSYPALQVANGDRCDYPTSVGVIAKEYMFCSRESWSYEKVD
jgi:hypothetical protein